MIVAVEEVAPSPQRPHTNFNCFARKHDRFVRVYEDTNEDAGPQQNASVRPYGVGDVSEGRR